MTYSDEQIQEVMGALAIDQETITLARTHPRVLEVLKRRTKKTFRKLALKWHPDRREGSEDKAQLLSLAKTVVDEIQGMQAMQHTRRVKWAVRFRARVVSTTG